MSNKTKSDHFDDETSSSKHFKSDNENYSEGLKLERFLNWCKEVGIEIDFDKVQITRNQTSHNIGMIAIKDIDQDVCIVKIPKASLLEPSTTEIKEFINKDEKELKSESNWSRLIISLMYECNNPKSKWTPYLDLFPNYKYLDLPMFWENSDVDKYLKNTCIKQNIEIDLENMKNEFNKQIIPFLKKHTKHFNERCYDFEYYKKLVAFIMAYSFTDPTEDPESDKRVGPMMVPVADILNHIAKNNAEIRFKPNELQICTNRPVKKNEEIYNTYGEHSNNDLLHMYGFTEEYPNNIFDNVEVPSKYLNEAMKKLRLFREDILDKKYEVFLELNLVDELTSIVIGNDGILNEEEFLELLQIYSMPADELEEFCDNDFEFEDEADDFSLKNSDLKNLPLDWKQLIKETCNLHLADLTNDNKKFDLIKHSSNNFKSREYYVKCLIDGHIQLLSNFLEYV